jgi:hypothetical protein
LAALAVEESKRPICGKRVRVPVEGVVLAQKRNGTTAGDQALNLDFWALVELAQPAEIAVRYGLKDKDIDLVRGNAGPARCVKSQQRFVFHAPEVVEALEVRKPKRKVNVLAFVSQRDSPAAIPRKPGNFFPRLFRDRADQRYSGHFRVFPPSRGDGVGSAPKFDIPAQQIFVLRLNIGGSEPGIAISPTIHRAKTLQDCSSASSALHFTPVFPPSPSPAFLVQQLHQVALSPLHRADFAHIGTECIVVVQTRVQCVHFF